MANNKVVAIALMVALVVVATMTVETEAVTCSPIALAPCAPAILGGAQPTNACCAQLVAQKPCLCGYKRNPSLRQYVQSPNAQRVASTCGVTVSC
ncbi:hypothetical protein RND81_08G224300 [Saponaria officinalis]|uniref:Bifunctional inhibitor/plant lipid transfer protein/seed storage helical domain-containing protein n=1 Tax=Saponaria officinalis TaxID=3572 RepID=A0AAW1JBT9_SAPOF